MKYLAVRGTAILFGVFLFALPVRASEVQGSVESFFKYSEAGWEQTAAAGATFGVLADFNADGEEESVIGASYGQPPLVELRRGDGTAASGFAAYDSGMLYGFAVATGDVDGDDSLEIVTAAAPGTNGHLRVFDAFGRIEAFPNGIFPFGTGSRAGAYISVGDIDGDGKDEIVVGSGPGLPPRVQIWASDGRGFLGELVPFDDGQPFGVSVVAADFNDDGRAEIATALVYGGDRKVRVFDGLTLLRTGEVASFGSGDGGGIRLDVARTNSGPLLHASYVTGKYEDRPWLPQYVRVDISEQRLYAYEFGKPAKSYLVSTGKNNFSTPTGDFAALAKPEYVHYRWSYGPNDPNNYDLGRVRWNVRFLPHLYIHTATWHNNFGRPMSHGCVNVSSKNAEWIYGWIRVGTPISIQT